MFMPLVPGHAALPEELDFAALQADAKKAFNERSRPSETYCTKCHGNQNEGRNQLRPGAQESRRNAFSKRWKQALANVKAHDMPPEDADKQPTDEERQKFLDWIGKIKFLSPKDPGPFVIRRLTKVEYGNTLHDLFGVDPAVAAELPDEVFGEGYLNTLSPLQSEQYLAIANDGAGPRPGARGCAAHRGAKAAFRRTAGAGRGSRARRRERSPAPWPATPIAGRRRRRNWTSCCGCSIWRAPTNSPTRRRCA